MKIPGVGRWEEIALRAEAIGIVARPDEVLGARTTYRVGGRASLVLDVSEPDRLTGLGDALDGVPLVVIGQGSNTLVSDSGFTGVAIVMGSGDAAGSAEDAIVFRSGGSTREPAEMEVGAAARLPVIARRAVAHGWCGAEWMVGVPGSVGGAVCMNAGGHGADVASMLRWADVLDLRTSRRAKVAARDLGLRFRGSALVGHHLVLGASFSVSETPTHDGSCADRLADIVGWRREHQPGGQNAGSVFVNPGDGEQSAGALIDSCGLRGRRVGSATVSEKHANFIQSEPGGRADDVVSLMCEVQDEVSRRHGITMRSEVRLIGFGSDVVGRFAVHEHYGVDDAEIAEATARLDSLI